MIVPGALRLGSVTEAVFHGTMARVSKWIALAVRLGLALTFAYTGVAKLTPDVNRSL